MPTLRLFNRLGIKDSVGSLIESNAKFLKFVGATLSSTNNEVTVTITGGSPSPYPTVIANGGSINGNYVGDVLCLGSATVTGISNIKGNLYCVNALIVTSDLSIDGNMYAYQCSKNANLTISGDCNTALVFANDSGNLTVKGKSIFGTLGGAGNYSFDNDVYCTTNLFIETNAPKTITFKKDLYAMGLVECKCTVGLNTLLVQGNFYAKSINLDSLNFASSRPSNLQVYGILYSGSSSLTISARSMFDINTNKTGGQITINEIKRMTTGTININVSGFSSTTTNGGNGGSVDIRNGRQSVIINSSGGDSSVGNGGNGGTIVHGGRVQSGSITNNGGNGNVNGGNGGTIQIQYYHNPTPGSYNINANGGNGTTGNGGHGGNITCDFLTGDVSLKGGDTASLTGLAGHAGNLTVVHSSAEYGGGYIGNSNILANGGNAPNSNQPRASGGQLLLNNVIISNIYIESGTSTNPAFSTDRAQIEFMGKCSVDNIRMTDHPEAKIFGYMAVVHIFTTSGTKNTLDNLLGGTSAPIVPINKLYYTNDNSQWFEVSGVAL